jgi:microsomal dipeptidase-like Zn-dependent dipeptidase
VARALQQRGHAAAFIEKIIGGNSHRVFKDISTL